MTEVMGAPTGVMVALATPLRADLSLDETGLDRLIDHITAAPVSGICPVGSTGEGPLLDRETRVAVTALTREKLGSSSPVIPATVSTTLKATVEDLHRYAEVGATAALVPPPFYYPLDRAAVLYFFRTVLSESPLPIILYNIPQMTKVSIVPDLVAELAQEPMVIGIKDSSRDFEYFTSVCEQIKRSGADNFSVLTGSDTMLAASILAGGSGTIAASVNLVPNLVCQLYQTSLAGNFAEIRTIQERLLRIVLAARRPGFPSGWKAALSMLNLCGPYPAAPNRVASEGAMSDLRIELTDLGVLS